MKRFALALLLGLALFGVHAADNAPPSPDLWLEDSASPATQAWVAARNAESNAKLERDPRYPAEVRRFLAQGGPTHSEDYLDGGFVHRLQSGRQAPLGRWQVKPASAAARALLGGSVWRTVLDLDALAKAEGVRWKFPLWWKNPSCDASIGPRCVVNLSSDGGDRTVLREIDLRSGKFVSAADGGFRIDTPARTYASWINADQLLLASDFGPGSLTSAGYARQARVWQRGTPHVEAKLIFEAPEDSVLYIPHNFHKSDGSPFFAAEVWHQAAGAPSWYWLQPGKGDSERWMPPVDLVRYRGLTGIVNDRLIAMTAQPLQQDGQTWPAGSLLALPMPDEAGDAGAIEPVFIPSPHEAVDAVFHLAVTNDALWFGVMHDVSGQLYRTWRAADGRWQREQQPLPEHAAVRLLTGEAAPSAALVKTESLLQPSQTSLRTATGSEIVDQASAAFDARRFLTEQHFATSRDGTRVPYYLVRARALAQDSHAPALITAYGGFGVSSLPTYLNSEFHTDLAAPLLRQGGVFVLANIRGGGEYGPQWHQQAQGRLRQHGFDDLIAVAESLGRSGWADPKKLGFIGSSNGGLLATAVAVQRPELWRAILADVPLTDMLRYHELFTGAVWIDEYGDPRQPEDRAVLATWSPLHNLRQGMRYPAMLLTTSSSDDRVHPGHARRFAEGLRKLGQPVLFHESKDSGHGGAASRESVARLRALQTVFLEQALDLKEKK